MGADARLTVDWIDSKDLDPASLNFHEEISLYQYISNSGGQGVTR